EAVANQRIGGNDVPYIRGDALAQLFWHLRRAEQTHQAIGCEVGGNGLLDRGNVRRGRGRGAVCGRPALWLFRVKFWPPRPPGPPCTSARVPRRDRWRPRPGCDRGLWSW